MGQLVIAMYRLRPIHFCYYDVTVACRIADGVGSRRSNELEFGKKIGYGFGMITAYIQN